MQVTTLQKRWALFCFLLIAIALVYSVIGVAGASILIAWALAFLLYPVRLYFQSKGLSALWATTAVCLICLLALGGALGFIVPRLIEEIPKLIDDLPKIASGLNEHIQSWSKSFGGVIGMSSDQTSELMNKQSESLVQSIGPKIVSNLQTLIVGGTESLFNVLSIFLLPVFFVYFLVNMKSFHSTLKSFVPNEPEDQMERLQNAWEKILQGYVRGLSLVCLFLATFYGLGLTLSGVKYGLAIGVIAGFLSFIPYLGSLIGFIASVILLLVYPSSVINWIGLGITFGAAQFFESYLVTPRLVGKNIGIHPGVVLLLILLGSQLGGIMGMLIAVPLGAIAIRIVFELFQSLKSHS